MCCVDTIQLRGWFGLPATLPTQASRPYMLAIGRQISPIHRRIRQSQYWKIQWLMLGKIPKRKHLKHCFRIGSSNEKALMCTSANAVFLSCQFVCLYWLSSTKHKTRSLCWKLEFVGYWEVSWFFIIKTFEIEGPVLFNFYVRVLYSNSIMDIWKACLVLFQRSVYYFILQIQSTCFLLD